MRIGRKIKTQGRTIGETTSHGEGGSPAEEEVESIEIFPMTGSINTTVSPILIDDKDFQVLEALLRDGVILSVGGPTTQTPTKPNSNKILGLANINNAGTITGLRFTKNTVYKLVAGVWTQITTGVALTGGDYDRFSVIYVEGRTFFNNNGVDVLQEINFGANTHAAAGNARKYKYYTVSNNRIIGANLIAGTNDPTEVAGCGDRNYAEWDPTVDISAFRQSLIDVEKTETDEITGVIGINNNRVLLLRSRTLWVGIPQPIASAPFNWIKIPSGYGCNAPYSVQKCGDAVIWYDPFTKNVYLYSLKDDSIIPIGDKVRDELANRIGGPTKCFSSYDDYNKEYVLCFEYAPGSFTHVFKFNRETNSWFKCTVENHFLTALLHSVTLQPTVTIDGLGGASIDSLTGTIDTLSDEALVSEEIFGTNTGERVKLDGLVNNSNFALQTKAFSIPGYYQIIKSVELHYTRQGSTNMNFGYFVDSDISIQGTSVSRTINDKTGINVTKVIPINKKCKYFSVTMDAVGLPAEVHKIKINRVRGGPL